MPGKTSKEFFHRNSQENTYGRLSFLIKLQALGVELY